jgi:hypothetical protein
LCHVCSTLISAEQRFQLGDQVYHLHCYEQLEEETVAKSNKLNQKEEEEEDPTNSLTAESVRNDSENKQESIEPRLNNSDATESQGQTAITDTSHDPMVEQITQNGNSINVVEETPSDSDKSEPSDVILTKSTDKSEPLDVILTKSTDKPEFPDVSLTKLTEKSSKKKEPETDYPDELNPFRSDDDDEEEAEIQLPDISGFDSNHSQNSNKVTIQINSRNVSVIGIKGECVKNATTAKKCTEDGDYPDHLNPFADDDNDSENETNNKNHVSNTKTSTIDDYDESLNPFADDDDEEETAVTSPKPKLPFYRAPPTAPRSSLQRTTPSSNCSESPYSSIRSPSTDVRNTSTPNRSTTPNAGKWRSNKKRTAPKPPTTISPSVSMTSSITFGDMSSMTSQSNPVTPEVSRRRQSLNSCSKSNVDSEASSMATSTHNLHNVERSFESLCNVNPSLDRSIDSHSKEAISLRSTSDTLPRVAKKKKAPSAPISVRRIVSCSAVEIIAEINDIGDKLAENENSIKQIEEKFEAHKSGTTEMTKGKLKKLIFEYLNLVSMKCALAKRQEELMYL